MDGKRPTIASLHGMVAAAHPLAAQAGAKLLAAGGNAFDAAAATAAALNVVEPGLSGLAGMGMATCYIAAEQGVRVLDFGARVPSALPAGRSGPRGGQDRGPSGCGAPGSLAGWCELAKAHGRKKLQEIVAPAVALARDGHALIEFAGASTKQAARALRDQPYFEDWRSTYLGSGTAGPGLMMRQPDLARTFEIIASEGPEHFYRGALGRKVIAHVQSLGGCLTMQDMAAVNPVWREPLAAAYRGLQVHVPLPPGEGWQLLLTLRILDGFDLGVMERGGADHLDTVWRAIRLAAGLGIGPNTPGPTALGRILSDELVEPLRARLRDPRALEGPTDQTLPEERDPTRELATSFSVVDREGNAVCVTQSLGGLFGCGVVVPGTGICLNTLLGWGEPDGRGAHKPTAGAELALPMAPLICTKDCKPVLLLGSPGSQALLQTLVQHADYGVAIQDAIETPRVRFGEGRRVRAEIRLPATIFEALRRRGHEVEAGVDWAMPVGAVQGISIDPQTCVAIGGADPRRDGYVAVP